MPVLHRFFFALLPPLALRLSIAGQCRGAGELRDVVAADRMHLTLGITAHYRRYVDQVVQALLWIGDRLRMGPAAVRLDELVLAPRLAALRPSSRPEGLTALSRAVTAPMERLGLLRPGYRCNPHLTLGYRAGPSSSRPIAPIGWRADELVLVHSHVGATRHDVVGRWPLRSGQGDLFGGDR